MRIWALEKYRKEGKRRKEGSFSHLPPGVREHAIRKHAEYCERWRGHLTPERRALLVAVASSVALHPRDSAWGRRMRAKKGAHAKHRKDVEEGRDPCEKARYVKAAKAKSRRSQKSQEGQNLAHRTTDPRTLGNNPKANPLVEGRDGPTVNFNKPEHFNGYMLHGVPIPPYPFRKP